MGVGIMSARTVLNEAEKHGRFRQSRTLHTLTLGPKSGVQFMLAWSRAHVRYLRWRSRKRTRRRSRRQARGFARSPRFRGDRQSFARRPSKEDWHHRQDNP